MNSRWIEKALLVALMLLGVALFIGCEGDPNDPQTWAKKLEQAVHREKAVDELVRIYTEALNKANGNNEDSSVKAIRDVAVPALVNAFKTYRDDVQGRDKILDALSTMEDSRAEEVFIAALDFTPDLSEGQCVKGAEGLGRLRAKRGVEPMKAALGRITGNRPVDNQMKRAIVDAFSQIKDPGAVTALIGILDTSADEQDFLINKLAAIALGEIGDPQAVPALIRALFMAGRGATIFQQASYSLVQIGPAAVEPLIRAMKGQDGELNRLGQALQFQPGVMQWKCARVLGDLGDARAIDALLEQLASTDPLVQGYAATALAELARSPEDQARVAAALIPKLDEESTSGAWPAIIGALAVMAGPERTAVVKRLFMREMLPDPGIRLAGALWWSRLASTDELRDFDATVNQEDDVELKAALNSHRPRFEAVVGAQGCGEDVACWIRKLDDSNPVIGDKAAYMLARLGVGNEAARNALISHLDTRNTDLREAVLFALDQLSPQGCAPCVEKIRAISAAEQGRQSYNVVNANALRTAARLSHRTH